MLRAGYQGGKGAARRSDDVGQARVWKEGPRGFYSLHQIRAVPYPAAPTWGAASFTCTLFLDVVAYLLAIYELISRVARDTSVVPALLTSIRFIFYHLVGQSFSFFQL